MSTTELVVVIFGGLLGYWIVSTFFFKNENTPKTGTQNKNEWHSSPNQAEAPASWNVVLGVSADASTDEIRKSYKVLISQYHPDRVSSLGDELRALAESKSKEINGAYQEAMRLRGEPG